MGSANLFWYPVLYVLFLWWFSTGIVIYLNNMRPHTHRISIAIASIVLLLSCYATFTIRNSASLSSAYIGFTCGLLVWAWTQLTFYTGFITGPRKDACPQSSRGFKRFRYAVETCIHHEIVAFILGAYLFALTYNHINNVAFWTYFILWALHLSAKLNVVFGVRNLNEEFFPERLLYLRSYLKEQPLNFFFPFSIAAATWVTVEVAQMILLPDVNPFETVAYTFYASLLALAVLEHWLLVLPIPAAVLWHWGLKSRKSSFDAPVPVIPKL